eukprot:4357810-Pyramimonas_sp.AAC.2
MVRCLGELLRVSTDGSKPACRITSCTSSDAYCSRYGSVLLNAVNANTLLAMRWNAGADGSMSIMLRHPPGFNTRNASLMTSTAALAGSSWKVRHELTRSWVLDSNGSFSPAPCWNLTL